MRGTAAYALCSDLLQAAEGLATQLLAADQTDVGGQTRLGLGVHQAGARGARLAPKTKQESLVVKLITLVICEAHNCQRHFWIAILKLDLLYDDKK